LVASLSCQGAGWFELEEVPVASWSSIDLYTGFFNLSRRPFSLVPDSRFLYWSRHHKRAYAMLEYGLLTRAPITLVTGEVGAGKSTLLFHLLGSASEDLRLGLVANAHGDRGELLHWVLLAFDLAPDPSESYVQLFGRLQEFLIAEYAAGRRVVLIFDEAQNLSLASLEELRMLTNINSGGDELLQLILVGQPELRDTVLSPDMKQFAQRVAASVHLPALDAEMVAEYLDSRLRTAGATGEIFQPGAVDLIFGATGGVPRLVNQLADLALVYAFTNDEKHVGRAIVQQVLDDGVFFGLRAPEEEEGRVLTLRHPIKKEAD
jgi:type II secretory pathway predicted ATPase ExeA